MRMNFKGGRKWKTSSPNTRFCSLSNIQVADSSTRPNMTTVFHVRLYGRSIEIKNNLWRKKHHRTNQGNFPAMGIRKKIRRQFYFYFCRRKGQIRRHYKAKIFKHGNYLKQLLFCFLLLDCFYTCSFVFTCVLRVITL